jgi:hypothetical protein
MTLADVSAMLSLKARYLLIVGTACSLVSCKTPSAGHQSNVDMNHGQQNEFNTDVDGNGVVNRIDFTLKRGQIVGDWLFGAGNAKTRSISAYDPAANTYTVDFEYTKPGSNNAGSFVIFENKASSVPSF